MERDSPGENQDAELSDDWARMRFKASNYDKLAEEVMQLRFKASRYDEVLAENVTLRYKARRYDQLVRYLGPIRPVVRLILRLRRQRGADGARS